MSKRYKKKRKLNLKKEEVKKVEKKKKKKEKKVKKKKVEKTKKRVVDLKEKKRTYKNLELYTILFIIEYCDLRINVYWDYQDQKKNTNIMFNKKPITLKDLYGRMEKRRFLMFRPNKVNIIKEFLSESLSKQLNKRRRDYFVSLRQDLQLFSSFYKKGVAEYNFDYFFYQFTKEKMDEIKKFINEQFKGLTINFKNDNNLFLGMCKVYNLTNF
jgi:hypothetical protein